MADLEERISQLLATKFQVKQAVLSPEKALSELAFDSLALIELSLVLDNEFGVALSEEELTGELTVRDVAELVASKGAAA